ncbi:MAG: hypothetical protein JO051_12520 [Acidobacteriaceae bacterium]|nr:hypothetical protein [Acidobacteriaceae bacterium]
MAQYQVWAAKDKRTFFLQAASKDQAIETIATIYRINNTELEAAANSPYSIAPQVIVESRKASAFSGRGREAVARYSITYDPLNSVGGLAKTITMNTAVEAWATVEVLQRSGQRVVIRRSGHEIGWEELRHEASPRDPDKSKTETHPRLSTPEQPTANEAGISQPPRSSGGGKLKLTPDSGS